VPHHVLRHIFIEGLSGVDHAVMLLIGMEHGEVHHEWVAFARNQILCDDRVSSGVGNLAKVDVLWENASLDLIICDLASVQLHDEVFLEDLHGVVLLEVGENLARTNRDLSVNHVASQLILTRLLFE